MQIDENIENGGIERVGIGLLNKPIINLFDGESHSNKYRQYLSVPSNFKEVKDYREYVNNAVQVMEKFN